jgi:hypothetical protein
MVTAGTVHQCDNVSKLIPGIYGGHLNIIESGAKIAEVCSSFWGHCHWLIQGHGCDIM